jgi:hypothetical protein
MKVTTYSKNDFLMLAASRDINDLTVDKLDEFFICVEPSGGPDSIDYFLKSHNNVVSINFDDVSEDGKKWGPDIQAWFEAKAMTETHAKILIDFIKKIKPDSQIHVYCTKGFSRSKSIADFIKEEFLNWEEQGPVWPEHPDAYFHIKNLLRAEWKNI